MSDDDRIAELQEKFTLLTKVKEDNDLKPGCIVRWKKGFRNKRLPKESQPAIVVEQLDKAVHDKGKDPSSAYFREPLDIILGFIDEEDEDFMMFHFDSRRFEVWPPKSE